MKSFLSGRPQVSANALQPVADSKVFDSARVISHAHHKGGTMPPHGNAPAIECIKQGDKVTRIVVTCSCGERIEIDCMYSPGA